MSHLARLEAEAIHIFREVAAESGAPVMLYSIGKDSSVLLHLARKAFLPGPLPFPLMHIDTGWKFREMIAFREQMRASVGKLIVYHNAEGAAAGVNPFGSGSSHYTQVMKTEALKQALRLHGFDTAIGGARRDEEASRAKERIFSFRTAAHAWDPKQQRPEFWQLYNGRVRSGEGVRVFPLSNWTELDVWTYIEREAIPIVSLYFAHDQPVVERDGSLIVVHDARMRLAPGEVSATRSVRFRSLGCYPLTGATLSTAATVAEIVAEMRSTTISERGGRLIDRDAGQSMEMKKREGYF